MEEQDFSLLGKRNTKIENNSIRKMWECIAQRPSEFDMEVINALKATIKSNNPSSLGYNADIYSSTDSNNNIYGCYGNELYLVMRERMMKYKTPSGKKICLLPNCILNQVKEGKEGNESKECKQGNESKEGKEDNDNKVVKTQKKVQLTKTEIILQKATQDKLAERLDKILGSLNYETYIQPGEGILKTDILEIRTIGFIYISWHLLLKPTMYIEKENILFPLSVIVFLQRYIKICNNYIGYNVANPRSTMEFSSIMIFDLQSLLNQLIKAYDFNGITLYTKASELILGCPLDVYLPKKSRTGFQHQIKVSETLLTPEILKKGFIMFYRTMTNSGKTSSIINMAAAVDLLRKKLPSVFGDLQIIATCDVNPVITRWGQLLYHAGFPFGIGSKRNISSNPDIARKILKKATKEMQEDQDCIDIGMRFSNSDTCKSIKDRLVIICPTDIALKILEKAPNASKRFILLHDEPTMYAESVDSPQLKTNMAIIKSAPKWAIFSSATLPYEPEKARVFIEHHRGRFPEAEFIDNTSAEIYSCCNLRKYDGGIITPHLGIKNRNELDNAITHIQYNPFLGKLYTPISAKELYDRACAIGYENKEFVSKVPRLMRIFNDVDNLFPDKIRTVSLDILKAMLELDDTEIEEICSGEEIEYESDKESGDDSSEESGEDSGDDSRKDINKDTNNKEMERGIEKEKVIEKAMEKGIEKEKVIEKAMEKGIEKVLDENIVFSSQEARAEFKVPRDINFEELGTKEAWRFPYLNLIASNTPNKFMLDSYSKLIDDVKKKITSLARLQRDYEQRLDAWKTSRDAFEKKIKNPEALSKKLSEHDDIRPNLIYPDDCQINTRAHINKYSKHALAEINSAKFRIPNTLDPGMLDDFHITEDMKLGLLSGVCFYAAPDTLPNEDEDYLNTALELTSLRNVESLVADSSICYGTDYPIGGVVITPEFASSHSLNTIYQLMSRAGRGRKSSNAEIYVSNECMERILETVRNGASYVNQETENMIKVFNSL